MYEQKTADVDNNTRAGFYYSLALHLSVVTAFALFAYVGILFSADEKIEDVPFEMVEPPAPRPPSDKISEEEAAQELEPVEVQEVEPLPQIENEPDVVEPEPEPAPTPKPTPKPEVKPIKKPKLVAKEPPKKISLEDFRKSNPEKKVTKRTTRTQAPVSVPKVGGSKSLDSVKYSNYQIDGLAGNNTQMVDALAAYQSYITKTARRNWVMPEASPNGMKATVAFKVSKDGTISDARIVKSSGLSAFDKSALASISTLSLVPPPDRLAHEVRVDFIAE